MHVAYNVALPNRSLKTMSTQGNPTLASDSSAAHHPTSVEQPPSQPILDECTPLDPSLPQKEPTDEKISSDLDQKTEVELKERQQTLFALLDIMMEMQSCDTKEEYDQLNLVKQKLLEQCRVLYNDDMSSLESVTGSRIWTSLED